MLTIQIGQCGCGGDVHNAVERIRIRTQRVKGTLVVVLLDRGVAVIHRVLVVRASQLARASSLVTSIKCGLTCHVSQLRIQRLQECESAGNVARLGVQDLRCGLPAGVSIAVAVKDSRGYCAALGARLAAVGVG